MNTYKSHVFLALPISRNPYSCKPGTVELHDGKVTGYIQIHRSCNTVHPKHFTIPSHVIAYKKKSPVHPGMRNQRIADPIARKALLRARFSQPKPYGLPCVHNNILVAGRSCKSEILAAEYLKLAQPRGSKPLCSTLDPSCTVPLLEFFVAYVQ